MPHSGAALSFQAGILLPSVTDQIDSHSGRLRSFASTNLFKAHTPPRDSRISPHMMDTSNGKSADERVLHSDDSNVATSSSASPIDHGAPELMGVSDDSHGGPETTIDEIEETKTGWFAYLTTRNFWIVLVLGYISLVVKI